LVANKVHRIGNRRDLTLKRLVNPAEVVTGEVQACHEYLIGPSALNTMSCVAAAFTHSLADATVQFPVKLSFRDCSAIIAATVNVGNVRMIERSQNFGLALEARHSLRVSRESFR
jgi:hypothetical protein